MSLSYGNAFEHFIVLEIYRLIKYFQPDWELFYLRTKDDAEIDLVIDRPGQKKVLIEIKSTSKPLNLQYDKLKSFANLVKSIENHEAYVLSQNPESRLVDGIYFMHWQKGLEHIGLNPSTDE
jgi:predicted AAA+ superfamily ATPase